VTFGLENSLATRYWSAVKTGTSKDMRDNWCVGFSARYTVAVWVGNFEGDSMHDVSGVSGAAPVWHEVMAALHANLPSPPPRAPAGITAAVTSFSPAVEPPRREWFLAGTSAPNVVALAQAAQIARFQSPSNGLIIALDPDIPSGYQRIPITAKGARADTLVTLDGNVLGHASEPILWSPRAGAHHLALVDEHGATLDRVLFTVR
jgi:penicillin-binding protein 1C